MTLEDVRVVLAKMREAKTCWGYLDPEEAHRMEDCLHESVLQAIASSQCVDCSPAELANEALKTNDIQFKRWYA